MTGPIDAEVRAAMPRALALELVRLLTDMSVEDLGIAEVLANTTAQMTYRLLPHDLRKMVMHTAMLARILAHEIPVARRDQVFAELSDLDRAS